jgi:Ca2+-binding RTX toxin-like protein
MTALARLALAWLAVSVGVTGLSGATASASVVTRASGFPISNENSIIVSDDKGTDPGQVNEIAIGLAPDFPDDYRITDTGGIQGQMPELCIRESGNSVRCSTTAPAGSNPDPQQVSRIFVALGGGDDTFSVLDPRGIPEDVLLEVEGGPGNDTILGRKGGGREILRGDRVDENESPVGPFGDDTLITGAPEDGKVLDGGGGNDVIVIIVNSQARSFMAAKSSRFGLLLGGAGNDRVTGGPGRDRMKGGPGRDRLKGRGGNDIIDCGGGKHDLGVGGGGVDLGKNCEKVKH